MKKNVKEIIQQPETQEQAEMVPFVKMPSYKKQFECICLISFGLLVCVQHHYNLDYRDFEWWISTLSGVLGLGIVFSADISVYKAEVKRFFHK